jgi:FkbM family methyltransferase
MQTRLRYLYRAYRYRYQVDAAELRYVRDSLRPGQLAVDIGCHKGAYTYWMRRRVGHTGRVIAFEPQPTQVAYLRQVFSRMSFDNVVLVPMAVSDRVGQATLRIPTAAGETHAASLEQEAGSHPKGPRRKARSTNHANRPSPSDSSLPAPCSMLSVPVTTLDAYFADQPRGPDFLKIDVEGHELAVLQGGRNVLETHRPRLLVECEARHRPDGNVRPVFDLLESLGYTGMFFQNGQRRRLAEFDQAEHQQVDPNTDRLPREYVNNFAFVRH